MRNGVVQAKSRIYWFFVKQCRERDASRRSRKESSHSEDKPLTTREKLEFGTRGRRATMNHYTLSGPCPSFSSISLQSVLLTCRLPPLPVLLLTRSCVRVFCPSKLQLHKRTLPILRHLLFPVNRSTRKHRSSPKFSILTWFCVPDPAS